MGLERLASGQVEGANALPAAEFGPDQREAWAEALFEVARANFDGFKDGEVPLDAWVDAVVAVIGSL